MQIMSADVVFELLRYHTVSHERGSMKIVVHHTGKLPRQLIYLVRTDH